MKIVFATWAKAEYQGRILNEEGGPRRLVSYWEHAEMKDDPIVHYAANGVSGKPTKRKK